MTRIRAICGARGGGAQLLLWHKNPPQTPGRRARVLWRETLRAAV